jgi:hypothetical protein
VSSPHRRSHSGLLVLPTAFLPQHCLLARLSPLHSVLDSSLALGITPFSIGIPCTLASLVLGAGLPLLISDSYPQHYLDLFRHRLHIATLPLSSSVSSLFYPPLSLFIKNTQTFLAEQSSLQLYSAVSSLTLALCNALRHCALSPTVHWPSLNYPALPRSNPLHFLLYNTSILI